MADWLRPSTSYHKHKTINKGGGRGGSHPSYLKLTITTNNANPLMNILANQFNADNYIEIKTNVSYPFVSQGLHNLYDKLN